LLLLTQISPQYDSLYLRGKRAKFPDKIEI